MPYMARCAYMILAIIKHIYLPNGTPLELGIFSIIKNGIKSYDTAPRGYHYFLSVRKSYGIRTLPGFGKHIKKSLPCHISDMHTSGF
jgi:hypothetical protein